MAATINLNIKASPGLPGGQSNAENITAAQQIKGSPGLLFTVVCLVAGTLTLLDSTTGTGQTLWISPSMTVGQVIPLYGFPFANGLYVSAVSGGTFNLSFT
jgi:hypothetical protein